MNWRTHALIGANAIWLVPAVGTVDETTALLVAVAAFAALFPDIDATTAKIHFLGNGIFGAFRGVFRHRGFFHSAVAVALLFAATWYFFRDYNPALPYVVAAAYASHPIIDGFNYPGVEYLYPWKKRIRLVPKVLASPVGGVTDQILFVVGIVGLLFFFISQYNLIQF